MVGVPRSKGCLTCRRRKVACDQTKPSCENCTKRGVQCEGYAKYPTILQYTNKGLKKRQRFEEAIVAPTPDAAALSSLTLLSRDTAVAAAPRTEPYVPYQPPSNSMVFDQIGASALYSYLCTSDTASAVQELKANWMWTSIGMDRGYAFQASLAALCFARVGLVNKDNNLLSQARNQYAVGLNALQYALKSPELAFQGQTLAAIRTLSIYELWALPWREANKAYVHETGMTQWCVQGGPQCIKSQFTLQVFHDVRWSIMNRSIDGRQRSPLGSDEWKTLPWQNFPKDSLQTLFDLGFDLAALLEGLEIAGSPQPPEAAVSKRAQLSLKCSSVQDSLDEWYMIYWSKDHASPASNVADTSDPGSSPGVSHFDFQSLWEATNIVYFWLFKMILNGILAETVPEEEQEDLNFSSLELAVNIVSSASYFLADSTGWLGPQRLFFPLRRAMIALQSKGSPFAQDAQQTLARLVQKLASDGTSH